jgi:hypothetical protein
LIENDSVLCIFKILQVYLCGIYGTYVYFYTVITFIVTEYHFFLDKIRRCKIGKRWYNKIRGIIYLNILGIFMATIFVYVYYKMKIQGSVKQVLLFMIYILHRPIKL